MLMVQGLFKFQKKEILLESILPLSIIRLPTSILNYLDMMHKNSGHLTLYQYQFKMTLGQPGVMCEAHGLYHMLILQIPVLKFPLFFFFSFFSLNAAG